MKSHRILILDGEQRASLAVTRSLGKRGLQVLVGSEHESSLAGVSKYAWKQVQYCSPHVSPSRFLEDLRQLLLTENVDNILPMTDLTVYHVLKFSQNLPVPPLPNASFQKYQLASNKMALIKMALELDIPVPDTIFVENSASLEDIIRTLEYPVILKPQASLIQHGQTIIRAGVKIIKNVDELKRVTRENAAFQHPFMIQEMVNGEGLGIFTQFREGKPVALFSHRRLREKPPWGGVSVISESTQPDPQAMEFALKLLGEIAWDGPAMVEFKRDDKRGVPVLMEINARFWGSLQLSIDAGVDFPYLLYLQAIGEPFEPLMSHRYSRLRWLLGDFDNLYITLKTPREVLPEAYRNKLKVMWNFVKESAGPARLEVLRSDDIMPFLWELRKYFADTLVRKSI